MIKVNTPNLHQRLIRALRGPGKPLAIILFGFASFVLGANLATVPHGAFYLICLWAIAVAFIALNWRD